METMRRFLFGERTKTENPMTVKAAQLILVEQTLKEILNKV